MTKHELSGLVSIPVEESHRVQTLALQYFDIPSPKLNYITGPVCPFSMLQGINYWVAHARAWPTHSNPSVTHLLILAHELYFIVKGNMYLVLTKEYIP